MLDSSSLHGRLDDVASKKKLAFVRLSTNFSLAQTIRFRRIVCANVRKLSAQLGRSLLRSSTETFRAAKCFDADHDL